MEFPLRIVDAFTLDGQHFSGNPAAICLLNYDDEITDENKQKIASEMNLSETAFVSKGWTKDSKFEKNSFTLRWFTAKQEVELCGHATLASARAVFDDILEKSENSIKFETKFKGILDIELDLSRQTIEIELPLFDPKPVDRKTNPWVEDIIWNILSPELTNNEIQDIQISEELKYLVIRLKDGNDLMTKMCPKYNKLLEIETNNSVKLVIITQKSDEDKRAHFHARHFNPWYGVEEDPVCGSAHSLLGPYWKRQYRERGLQFDQMISKSRSKRGGIVVCKVIGDRVKLSGNTRTVVSGKILI